MTLCTIAYYYDDKTFERFFAMDYARDRDLLIRLISWLIANDVPFEGSTGNPKKVYK